MNDPYYAKWAKIIKDLETGEFTPESIDPRDISVQFGQPLTEEQFKNRTVGGQPVRVIKPNELAAPAAAERTVGDAERTVGDAERTVGNAERTVGADARAALKAKIDAMAKSRSGK